MPLDSVRLSDDTSSVRTATAVSMFVTVLKVELVHDRRPDFRLSLPSRHPRTRIFMLSYGDFVGVCESRMKSQLGNDLRQGLSLSESPQTGIAIGATADCWPLRPASRSSHCQFASKRPRMRTRQSTTGRISDGDERETQKGCPAIAGHA